MKNQPKSYTFFGQKMTVAAAEIMLERKKLELAEAERQAIRGSDLGHTAIVQLKAKCEYLFNEIKLAVNKINRFK